MVPVSYGYGHHIKVSLSGIIQILYEQPDFDQIIISYDV